MIPCETIVRMHNMIGRADADIEPAFKCLRIDNGLVVAADRRFMAIECVGGDAGVIHLPISAALLEQCKLEAMFNGKLSVDASGRVTTTLGWSENVSLVWQGGDFDRWRSVVKDALPAPTSGRGGMMWEAVDVARLAASSPSGIVVFQENVDNHRPTLIRDVNDPNWLGVFRPNGQDSGRMIMPASLPNWLVLP